MGFGDPPVGVSSYKLLDADSGSINRFLGPLGAACDPRGGTPDPIYEG